MDLPLTSSFGSIKYPLDQRLMNYLQGASGIGSGVRQAPLDLAGSEP